MRKNDQAAPATGRSSRRTGPSDQGRPEVIEETAELMLAAGRLDVLVNDIFGGGRFTQWERMVWEHDLDAGFHVLRLGLHTHLVTIRHLVPLMLRTGGGLVVEMSDGTSEYNADFRRDVGFYYDLVKAGVERIGKGLAAELSIAEQDCTAVTVTPATWTAHAPTAGSSTPSSPGSASPGPRPATARTVRSPP